MKRIFKSIAIIAMSFVMVFGSTMSTYAVTNIETNSEAQVSDEIMPRSTNINTSWTTILTSSTGFNRDVYITAITFDPSGLLSTVPCDIRLLGKNNNVVWTGWSEVPGNNVTKTFWCGSDVYKVQIRTTSGDGVAYAR